MIDILIPITWYLYYLYLYYWYLLMFCKAILGKIIENNNDAVLSVLSQNYALF